uniref:Uncharacterized protein n=1 Tax=Schistocephalus solidus TaxID=70667 RepID=A0A0X3PWH1_SCHSO
MSSFSGQRWLIFTNVGFRHPYKRLPLAHSWSSTAGVQCCRSPSGTVSYFETSEMRSTQKLSYHSSSGHGSDSWTFGIRSPLLAETICGTAHTCCLGSPHINITEAGYIRYARSRTKYK